MLLKAASSEQIPGSVSIRSFQACSQSGVQPTTGRTPAGRACRGGESGGKRKVFRRGEGRDRDEGRLRACCGGPGPCQPAGVQTTGERWHSCLSPSSPIARWSLVDNNCGARDLRTGTRRPRSRDRAAVCAGNRHAVEEQRAPALRGRDCPPAAARATIWR
jgi:hypothetical protein